MSDQAVRTLIEQMERWDADPLWDTDPEAIAKWHADLLAAKAQAEKGPGWPELVARAHALGKRLDIRTTHLMQLRDQIKAELVGQERAGRALKGYGAITQ